MDIRTKEAVRYLGYGRHAIDERTLQLIEDSWKELESTANAKFIYRIFETSFSDTDMLTIGKMNIKSQSLTKNMKGCGKAVVFAATLGTEVDRKMRQYSVTDMAKAVVWQSCAAAFLEEYCDEAQSSIEQMLEREAWYLRPRFSPGYGDFSIHHQKELLGMLDAAKKIGLTLTESGMLTPTKSVTAVIGMSRTKEPCHRKGCEECAKTDCKYRRS